MNSYNKIKDINKKAELSRVQAQDDSGIILINQAGFYQKNVYKHLELQKTKRDLLYLWKILSFQILYC